MSNRRRAFTLGLVCAGALVIQSCDGDGTQPPDLTPAALQKLSGDEQSGVVGTQLEDPLVVSVTNDDGDPIQGTLVNFVVTSGGGSVFAGAGISNASGIVQERWTLGTSASTDQRVEARAVDNDTGEPIVFATFTATARPDAPASLGKAAGDGQEATVGTTVAVPPMVIVRDRHGNAVSGITVQFEIVNGGGTIQHASVTSDDEGRASVGRWTLGNTAVAQALRASAAGVDPVIFTATATAAAPTRLFIDGTPPTTATSGATIGPIVLRMQDAHGNVVRQAGIQVTASLASGDGTLGGGTTVTTDAEGRATFASLSISGSAGEKSLRFSAGDLTPVTISLTVSAGTPANMIELVDDGQVIPAGGTASHPPSVRVTDAAGNRLAGVQVTFAITAGGGSLTDAIRTTNTDGVATVGSWTVGTQPGTAMVTASANGTPGATFTATIVAGPPASLTKIAGDGQTATVGTTVSVAPKVRVTDAHGNPASGLTVTFGVTSGNGSVTNATPTTNAAGEAAVGSWTLGTTTDENRLRASVGGLSVSFTATGTPVVGSGARITITAGSVTQAMPNSELPDRLIARVTDEHGNPLSGVRVEWHWFGGSLTPERALSCTSMEERLRGLRWCQTHRESTSDAEGYVHATRRLGNIIGDRQFTTVRYSSATASFEHPVVDVFTAEAVEMSWTKCVLKAGQPYCFTNDRAALVAGAPPLTAITVGNGFACGLTSEGVAYCWGHNRYGQLGDGSTTERQTPAPVAGTTRFTSISAQYDHTCALTSEGTAYCWGLNSSSQLGSTTSSPCTASSTGAPVSCATQPQAVSTTVRFRQISAASQHTCALDQQGSAWCWGTGFEGQLGDGTRNTRSTPTAVRGNRTYTQIAAAMNSTCALAAAAVYCWGLYFGLEPAVARAAGAISIAHGDGHLCALEGDGRIYCHATGSLGNLYGYLGTGSNLLGYPETGNGSGYVATSKRFTAVAASRFQTCGVAESGQVYCWGQNSPDPSTYLPNYVHPPAP